MDARQNRAIAMLAIGLAEIIPSRGQRTQPRAARPPDCAKSKIERRRVAAMAGER